MESTIQDITAIEAGMWKRHVINDMRQNPTIKKFSILTSLLTQDGAIKLKSLLINDGYHVEFRAPSIDADTGQTIGECLVIYSK